MSYKIKALTDFEKELKRLSKKYKSLGFDLSKLIVNLQENPSLGTPIGKNLNKIRLAISSKNQGKSGGARLITCFQVIEETIYLVYIYDKSEIDNISEKKIKELAKNFEK
jgi:mRNA-degrading endonuclease RelE of RelBE toxin-antitoxin system